MNPLARFKKAFIGDRSFYRRVLAVLLPIMIQNAFSTFVSMLDNIMVGMVGTESMSGVSIANQLFFVYNLIIYGAMSGPGIYTAQYAGKQDYEGVRSTFRFKLWIGLIVTALVIVAFLQFGPQLLNLYLLGEAAELDAAATLNFGLEYLHIILLSLPAFFMLQVYASTLRECGETRVPMVAGVCAVLVNFVLNYVLIFGKLGLPALGSAGAAIATVVSRYVEVGIVMVWTHRNGMKQPWITGAWKRLLIPAREMIRFFQKSVPLLVNETLWAIAIAFTNQSYSLRGLEVVAAQNIANNLTQFTNIIFMSMGSAVGILIGHILGTGDLKRAKDEDNKMIFTSVLLSLISAVLLLILSPVFPKIYNTTDSIRSLATSFMLVTAVFVVQQAYLHATYFTLRSGGKTLITMLFDSCSTWLLTFTTAFMLCHYTQMNIVWIMVCVNLADSVRVIVGTVMLKKNIWLNNIVS